MMIRLPTSASRAAGFAPRLALVAAAALLLAAAWRPLSEALRPVAPAPPAGLPTQAVAAPPRAVPDYGGIAAAHLFGTYDPDAESAAAAAEAAAAAAAEQPAEEAVETTLALRVTGIVYAADGAARALISGTGLAREEAFAVGDVIVDGVELEAIEPYRVLIRNRGRLEAVLLPGADGDAPGGGSTVVAPPPRLPGQGADREVAAALDDSP